MLQEFNFIITYHLEYIRCPKPDCGKCEKGHGHGPYWFASLADDQNTRRMYVGKEFKEMQPEDFLFHEMFSCNTDTIDFKDQESNQTQPTEASTEDLILEKEITSKNKIIDIIDISKIRRKKKKQNSTLPVQPPSIVEFKNDLSRFKTGRIREGIKNQYKVLVKKYHPDQFPQASEMNDWMAEINSNFQELLKRAI